MKKNEIKVGGKGLTDFLAAYADVTGVAPSAPYAPDVKALWSDWKKANRPDAREFILRNDPIGKVLTEARRRRIWR